MPQVNYIVLLRDAKTPPCIRLFKHFTLNHHELFQKGNYIMSESNM